MKKESPIGIALTKCYICGGDKEIVMNTILSPWAAKKVEEMHGKCIDKTPCNKCLQHMEQGIILISVKDGESSENPYRTGGWVVIKEKAFISIFKEAEQVLKTRVCFVEDTTWDIIGLPRGETNEKQ